MKASRERGGRVLGSVFGLTLRLSRPFAWGDSVNCVRRCVGIIEAGGGPGVCGGTELLELWRLKCDPIEGDSRGGCMIEFDGLRSDGAMGVVGPFG